MKNTQNMTEKQKAWKFLKKVTKPSRYTGGELNEIIKDKSKIDARFAFCFPDTYEIGMSNLGMKILCNCLNNSPRIWCERCFAPWPDMGQVLRDNNIDLYALESGDSLKMFDFVGFTLQYEMSYTNVLNMLELGGIPLHKTAGRYHEPTSAALFIPGHFQQRVYGLLLSGVNEAAGVYYYRIGVRGIGRYFISRVREFAQHKLTVHAVLGAAQRHHANRLYQFDHILSVLRGGAGHSPASSYSRLYSSRDISTMRGFAPSAAPIMPRAVMSSTMRPARA